MKMALANLFFIAPESSRERNTENDLSSIIVDLMNHGGNNDEKLQWKFNEDKNTLDFISCKDIIYEMEELLINYSGEYSGVEPLKQFPPFHFFIFYGFLEEQQPLSIEQSKL